MAYDETTGETSYETIEAAWVHLDPLIVHLTIEGETIETTPNHPFYTERGWVEAGELWVGAAIYTANGNYGHVQAIQLAPHPQPMYDLTVATTHTFFVGAGQWLVHNCNGEFSIINWDGYPEGAPRPEGPFRLVEGDEYQQARGIADITNNRLHNDPAYNGFHIHEVQPVKFGGSPTDLTNKIRLLPTTHYRFNAWWKNVQRWVEIGQ